MVPPGGARRRCLPTRAGASERDAELEREQLVELQALDRPSELLGVGREVDVAERGVQVLEALGVDQVRGHRVLDRRQTLQRGEDELPDRSRRDALGGPVDRRDPARVHEIAFVVAEDLGLEVGELEAAPVPRDGPRHGHLDALL